MNSYERYLKGRTSEEWAHVKTQAADYLAQIQPVLDRLHAKDITRTEALDLLTEIKGGGDLARRSADRLISRSVLGERYE